MTDRRSPMASSAVTSGDDDARVLAARARRLARPIAAVSTSTVAHDTLVFRRGRDRFGLTLDAVIDVQRGPALAHLPTAAAPVIGVIAWRGRVLTVIDPAPTPSEVRELDREWRAIIIGRTRAGVAMYADAVEDAREIGDGEILSLDDGVASVLRLPVRGITSDALVLLDGRALLEQYSG